MAREMQACRIIGGSRTSWLPPEVAVSPIMLYKHLVASCSSIRAAGSYVHCLREPGRRLCDSQVSPSFLWSTCKIPANWYWRYSS